MRLNKLISNSLAIGLILNNASFSLASVISEDGRYETFEGDNITIDNILEENKVDVEIEGNTMVNIANQKDPVPITKSYSVEGTNHIALQGEYDGKARPVIEGNTMYYNNDTGELTDTFIEGANLSLVSSFEDQLVTQDMVDSGKEKPENLGKYKVEYKVTGKNKFDFNKFTSKDVLLHPDRGSYEVDENSIIIYTSVIDNHTGGILTDIGNELPEEYRYKSMKISPNTNLSLSADIENACNIYIAWYDINYKLISYGSLGSYNQEKPFRHQAQSPNNAHYLVIRFGSLIEDSTTVISNIQIEEGSTATEYESYKESIKTFYLNSPLLEGDTIEDVDGKATHIRRYNQIILNGRENWNINPNGTVDGYLLFYTNQNFVNTNELENTAISDKFIVNADVYKANYECFVTNEHGRVYIKIHESKLDTPDVLGIKQWLTSNLVNIVYRMKTPIYETISEESILIDSYKDGYLDLNTNIPVNKVDFIPITTNLNYLYPSTEYTVQFESDNIGKIDKLSLGNEVLYNDYSVVKGINRFNITTPSSISSTELSIDGIGFNLSDLIVTEATSESFDYFEGIKSVGQDDINSHKMELSSDNINLFDINKDINQKYNGMITGDNSININKVLDDGGIESNLYSYSHHGRGQIIKLKKNTNYRIKARVVNHGHIIVKTNKNRDLKAIYANNNTVNQVFNTGNEEEICLSFVTFGYGNLPNAVFYDLQLTLDIYDKNYTPHQSNTLQIPLSEPLRSLPNGVKDRIIKRNGQWVVERNIGEITFDGSDDEAWQKDVNAIYENTLIFRVINLNTIKINNNPNVYCDTLPSKAVYYKDEEGAFHNHHPNMFIRILKSRLTNDTVNDFKEWLSQNPTTMVYQLATPIYEPLNIDPIINLYLDTTHISNNSNIPANMKVTVDRAINKATEAIELAKTNPTIANISQARMWTNLLKESTLKDEVHKEIDSITNIEDLQLEKKKVTSNVDIYVKSDNMLLMTLSTNTIKFENYSGVDDIELDNAINISVNSSLPYQLNSYLLSELESSDKSNKIEKDLLNIKTNSDSDYKVFNNINEKLILEDDCESGNNKSHSIDFKLIGGDAHKADIYKAVIKFEAEQK